jgi:signal transduction histidine kinase
VSPGEQEAARQARSLADLLKARGPRILAACEARLVALENAVVADPAALEQMRVHMSQVLHDVTESLLLGEVVIDESYSMTARTIGLARASVGIPPEDSLQVGSVLLDTLLTEMADALDPGSGDVVLFAFVVRAVEHSISRRVREAFAAYTSFLLNQVREAQISERRRIARELHDRLGHCVSVAHHQLELFSVYEATDRRKATEKVEIAHSAVQEAISNLRAVTSDLYAAMRAKGLEKALLQDLELADGAGLDVRLRVSGEESWAGAEVLDECFLILREAIRNTLRHAGASTLAIDVFIAPHEIRAHVTDNGRGFDPSVPAESGGVGVSAMRERVELLGGRIFLRSEIGRGTEVEFTVPL